jgi:hypothetical protein
MRASFKANWRGVFALVSLLIGEALASAALDRGFGALPIGPAEFGAAIVAEVELGKIAMQMSLAPNYIPDIAESVIYAMRRTGRNEQGQ